jgi:hypothetical protein
MDSDIEENGDRGGKWGKKGKKKMRSKHLPGRWMDVNLDLDKKV